MITLHTNYGDISIELDHEHTPITAENFLRYAQEGFYADTLFHRVIPGFMIQGGGHDRDFDLKDTHESIQNEAGAGGKNVRGSLAMARTGHPHSASSQFFINLVDNAFLNYQSDTPQGYGYCVFGHVVQGMDVVDRIAAVKTGHYAGHQDVPVEQVVIERVSLDNSVA